MSETRLDTTVVDALTEIGADLATARAIREDIDHRVRALIQQLTSGDM